MKKPAICCLFCLAFIFAGCRNYKLPAESGTKWVSENSSMYIVLSNENYGTGTLTIENELTEIECHFGPGKTEFVVYESPEHSTNPTNGDAWLFRGDYYYNKQNQTIVLDIVEKQIGLPGEQIVLYQVGA